MLGDELLDVPTEPRLRPAALIVLSRLLLRAVDDFVQPSAAQLEDLAALAVHERDEGAVAVPCEIDERRQPELAAEVHVVRHRSRQWQHPPEVIGARDEDRDTTRAVAVELATPPLPDPLEVAADGDLLVVRPPAAVRELLLGPCEQ